MPVVDELTQAQQWVPDAGGRQIEREQQWQLHAHALKRLIREQAPLNCPLPPAGHIVGPLFSQFDQGAAPPDLFPCPCRSQCGLVSSPLWCPGGQLWASQPTWLPSSWCSTTAAAASTSSPSGSTPCPTASSGEQAGLVIGHDCAVPCKVLLGLGETTLLQLPRLWRVDGMLPPAG